jgi:hypothetical protein
LGVVDIHSHDRFAGVVAVDVPGLACLLDVDFHIYIAVFERLAHIAEFGHSIRLRVIVDGGEGLRVEVDRRGSAADFRVEV